MACSSGVYRIERKQELNLVECFCLLGEQCRIAGIESGPGIVDRIAHELNGIRHRRGLDKPEPIALVRLLPRG
jgi:hypothetical protein